MNHWTPNPHFKPGHAPTESEENRLFPFALAMWRAKRNPDRDKFPYPLANVRMEFRHTLRQWWAIGTAKGKGNRAWKRVEALNRKNGPWLNWPEMTITAS